MQTNTFCLKLLLVAFLLLAVIGVGAFSTTNRAIMTTTTTATKLQNIPSSSCSSSACFEVVGSGRIASLFLRQEGGIAVPRKTKLGVQSLTGCPIVVATPSRAWPALFEACPLERRTDIIWMGNGLPRHDLTATTTITSANDDDNNNTTKQTTTTTWVVPHFGVLQINGPIVSSETSPPTYCFGKHASFLENVLMRKGLRSKVEQVASLQILKRHALRKLIWASSMWLLCHHQSEGNKQNHDTDKQQQHPLTVTQVHEQRDALLRELVGELLPVANEVLLSTSSLSEQQQQQENDNDNDDDSLASVLAYMEQYSRSMPNAIPSRTLGLAELSERNGVFLRGRPGQQPCHERLVMEQQQRTEQPKASST